MGMARSSWQNLKKQMEDAPKFGKAWVSQNFKQDLGPDLDDVEAACHSYAAHAADLDKAVAKLQEQQAHISALAHGISGKFASYSSLVKARSSQEKTEHGAQIDGIISQIKKVYVNVFNPVQVRLMHTTKAVDALAHHKIS